MNMLKRAMAMLMVLCMLVSAVPMMALAAETDATEPAVELTNQTATVADTGFYRILHLDCGRKYFTKDWIIALINEMSAAGYTHLELAFGNDGLRFLLDDMSVGSYTDAQVTAAVQQGNRNYHDFGTNELTEAEMNAIIAHANRMGIKILPLLNNPGHMNAIVSASSTLTGSSAGFDGSATTVDLENTAAVNFTKGLVEKYIAYFSSKGCTEFNFGADEYANDRYSGGSMGFGALVNQGKYQLFVNYVNEMAALIKGYNMTPIVFNDGIYFNNATSYNFDKDITVAFWTSGWYGYQSASASRMAELGHEMINVHGDFYYVTGKNDCWTPGNGTTHDPNLYTEASGWSNTAFMGSTVSNPAGSMFCIWCDYPAFETETQIAANIRLALRAMAAEMQGRDAASISTEVVSGGFNADGTISESREWVTISEGDVKVSGYDLTRAEVTQVPAEEMPTVDDVKNALAWNVVPYVGDEAYTDRCEVSLPVPEGWNTALVTGFYVENGRTVMVEGTYADGYFTFELPSAAVAGIAEVEYNKLIELIVGESKTETIDDVDLSGEVFTPNPAGIADVTTEVNMVPGEKSLEKVTSLSGIVSGEKYVLVNTRSGNYLHNEVTTRSGKNILTQAQDSQASKYSVNSTSWTITREGDNFYIYNNGYITIGGQDTADLTATKTALVIHDYGDETFAIGQGGQYLNDTANSGTHAGGYWALDDGGAHWQFFRIKTAEVADGTNVTFTGRTAGDTYVTINNTVYMIKVRDTVTITVHYVDQNGNTIKTEYVDVPYNATTHTVSDFEHNGQTYTARHSTLNITPLTQKEYSVTVGVAGEVFYDKLVELNVGESKTEVIGGIDLSGETFTPDPAGIASVAVEGHGAITDTTVSDTAATELEDGATYIIKFPGSNYVITSNQGGTTWGNSDGAPRKFETFNGPEAKNMWTFEASGNGFKVRSAAGYLNLGRNAAWLNATGEVFTIIGTGTELNLRDADGYVINDLGGLTTYYCAGGWQNASTKLNFYKVTKPAEASTTVTFTGDAPGDAYVTINNVIYKIVVHGQVPITIRYVDQEGNEVKTEEVMVADNATSYELSDFSDGDKFYIVEEKTLAIDPRNTTSYTVSVVETEEDLDAVAPLTIEYWQTNAPVKDGDDVANTSRTVRARDVYSEDGMDVTDLLPADPHKYDSGEGDPDLGFWWAKLLERATHEQTGTDGDDETLSGVAFTKVRYWNGQWAVFTEDGEWNEIEAENLGDYQFVFYFMNDMHLADEVMVGTSDWGKLGDGTYGNQYLGRDHVSLAFQVVYEDGTTSPETTTADDLASVTYLVDRWDPARGIGSMSINEIADYQIWKVTAETGTHTTTWAHMSPTYITNFTWDDNEMTVWEGDPVSSYTIVNPAKNPSKEGAYANLTWDEQNESILIRIYIKAVETEDSLTVVYCDETFGDTLYTYNVLVPGDTNFTDDIEGETVFAGNDQRIDVSGAYIVNNQNKPQYFQTDLSGVPQIVGKYNSNLYTYTGSEISEDGKTLYLYYNFDESALPVYVVDFGLPLTFSLIEITQAEVSSVTVTEQTRYGRLSYRSDPKNIGGIFIYQPTSILQGADMLTINITFADGSTSTSNIMVLPATSVYYEEGFIFNENSTGWENTGNKGQYMQYTEAIGRKVNNYGYDDVYTDTPGASCESNATASQIGAKTTFTFTGNGIQIFANATEESGYVAVEVKDSTGKVVNVSMVDTVVKGGETDATEGQEGNLYGLPIVSLVDLQNMPHGTYTVKLTKIMNDKPVYIDGIRVFNTMADSSAYAEDLEDNPEFYELRDYVLNAVQIDDETSKDYGTLAEMANQVYAGISTDTEAPVAMVTTGIGDVYGDGATAQDLLDNGPKNELYLYPRQTLSFKVTTARVMQIGLKAPSGSTSATITVDGTARPQRITSSVDMFYSLTTQPGTEQEHLISITNDGENILSVTLLKVCDDPEFAFGALTEQDVEKLLQASFRASGESPVLTGDVDGDWDVDAADLTLVARHVGGIELLSDEMLKNADVDGDGIVNARDLTIHARFTGGIILRWKDDADQTA